jgi:hypothetical protein
MAVLITLKGINSRLITKINTRFQPDVPGWCKRNYGELHHLTVIPIKSGAPRAARNGLKQVSLELLHQ